MLSCLWAKCGANAMNKTNKSRSPWSRGLVWMATMEQGVQRAMTVAKMCRVLWGEQQGSTLEKCHLHPSWLAAELHVTILSLLFFQKIIPNSNGFSHPTL